MSRDGGTGRRTGLKILRGQPHEGSIPSRGIEKHMLAYLWEIFLLSYLALAVLLSFFFLKQYQGRLKYPLAITAAICAILWGYSAYIEPYLLTVRTVEINSPKINQEIKIVLLSDTHLRPGKRADFVARLEKKIAGLKPDLILLAGDFLFHDDIGRYQKDLTEFKKLTQIAHTYAVLGNHDYGLGNKKLTITYEDDHEELLKILTSDGIKVLRDANTKLEIKGEQIQLVGFDEYWLPAKQPKKAIINLEKNIFTLGLSHDPDTGLELEAKKLDLLLSGHTHGGQIRLPWIGAIGEAQTKFSKADYGQYLSGNQPPILNTSGVGESGAHLRFWNRPEIVLLKIK